MSKYHYHNNPEFVIEVTEAEEDTTIQTQWGPALITAGNMIAEVVEDNNRIDPQVGSKFGITPQDLEAQYKAVA